MPPIPPVSSSRRPKLTAETVVDYLDWITANFSTLPSGQALLHMQAAELTVRTLATAAQGKATQHTLVEQGIIAPPPVAS